MTPTPVSWSARIPAGLLAAAKAKASAEGISLTSIVIKALERYVKSK